MCVWVGVVLRGCVLTCACGVEDVCAVLRVRVRPCPGPCVPKIYGDGVG